jgi:hypothetical protein
MMRSTLLPFLNFSTPVIESAAGMPVRRGSKGVLAVAFREGRAAGVFLCFDRDITSSVYFNTILVIGCTSQITGMRLFKLGGPGCEPVACVISKNKEPSICTGMGGS